MKRNVDYKLEDNYKCDMKRDVRLIFDSYIVRTLSVIEIMLVH